MKNQDKHSCYLAIDGEHYNVPEDVYWYVRKLEKKSELLEDTPFRKPNKDCYRYVKTIRNVGTVQIGVEDGYDVALIEGLWEKDGKEYIGYFSTTGLLPDYSEEIYETISEWMDANCMHVKDCVYKVK